MSVMPPAVGVWQSAIAPNTVFVPMHWGYLWTDKSQANALTHLISCPDSLQPELNTYTVQIVSLAVKTADYSSASLLQTQP